MLYKVPEATFALRSASIASACFLVQHLSVSVFTGVVLVVTLAHDRLGRAEISLDTVVVMFRTCTGLAARF